MKTKKNKLTNILKIGILLFGISLLLFNCEKDYEINEPFNVSVNNKLDYTLEKIGYSELVTDQEIQKSLPNIKNHFSTSKKRRTLNRKTTEISEHFSIITDSIHKIITKDAITWTFKIETPVLQNSDFENFLIKKHNEEFSYFLVSYEKDLEKEYKKVTSYPISKKFLNLDNLNLTRRGDYLMDDGISNGGGSGCQGVITHQPCSNGDSYLHGPEPYISGGYCSGTTTIIDFSHCFITGTSNNGNSSTNNTSNNNNTLYNSGGGSSSNGGSTITNPVTLECDNCSNSQSLISHLNLTDQVQINWVNDSANLLEVDALFDFGDTKQWSNEAKNLIRGFIELKTEIPNAKLERYEELMELIKDNPFALLEDCMQQNGLDIANYQQLYDHTLPQSCIDRLDNLGSDFKDQPLNTGNSAVANVDYYAVEITTNPDLNNDGNPDTDAEVYEGYKSNFTDLASGSKDNFKFSCNIPFNSSNTVDVGWDFDPYLNSDLVKWLSNQPVTAIFKISAFADAIGLGLAADDGAIMISKFTSTYWIGSTITTERTGTQPFSGNRQWGYLTNQNGNLELYARAVDIARVSNATKYNPLGNSECKEDTYYNIGEATWSNLQEEIKQWINNNGGQSNVVPKTAIRFDKNKLKKILESNETIDKINCN